MGVAMRYFGNRVIDGLQGEAVMHMGVCLHSSINL